MTKNEKEREIERAVGDGNGHRVFSHCGDICRGKSLDSFKHKMIFCLSPSHFGGFLSNSCYAAVGSRFRSQPMDPFPFKIISFVHFHLPYWFLKSQLQSCCAFTAQKKRKRGCHLFKWMCLCFRQINSFSSQLS